MDGERQYPKRESHFAHKAVRAMVKTCVANEFGSDVFTLLTIIAHTEDAAHYRRPVTFYAHALMPLIGVNSETSFKRIRDRAIKSGWLVYVPGAKRRPAKYWVQIPEYADGLDDLPSDEGDEPQHNSSPPVDRNADDKRTECGRQSTDIVPAFNPVPIPDPNPIKKSAPPKKDFDVVFPPELDTPEFRDTWAEWTAFRKEKKNALTERMVKGQFKFLARIAVSHGLGAAIECIESSIRGGYTGLFEPRPPPSGTPHARQVKSPSRAKGRDEPYPQTSSPGCRSASEPDSLGDEGLDWYSHQEK